MGYPTRNRRELVCRLGEFVVPPSGGSHRLKAEQRTRPWMPLEPFAIFACLLLAGSTGAEQAVLPGDVESGRVARRLADADHLFEQQRWTDAVEEYQRILDDAANVLVPAHSEKKEPEKKTYLPARWRCQHRLAALPPEALRAYRERIDGQARKWLEQGRTRRDERPLRKLVDEAFCSRHADQALDLLGDLAFERGDFAAAERYWRFLLPPTQAKNTSDELFFPDPQVDKARIQAKCLLLRLFSDDTAGLEEALRCFRKRYGQATGQLAGRQGKYAEILEDLYRHPELHTPPRADAAGWSTFAGDPSRNHVSPQKPRKLPYDTPPWSVDVNFAPAQRPEQQRTPTASPLPALYPAIAGDRVVVADGRFVAAFDLKTGGPRGKFDLLGELQMDDPRFDSKKQPFPEARHSVTIADGYIFARLGNQVLSRTAAGDRTEAQSFLVCLDLMADAQGKLAPRWPPIQPDRPAKKPAVFEGPPVVHEGRVYIAQTRFEPAAVATIACYDADNGAVRWRQDVCQIQDFQALPRHHLLTLAGSNVVYCSHSGAVVAVDAVSGRRAWAFLYPSRGDLWTDGKPSPRDLAPAVHAGGRLYVAPTDYGRILCLDPDTGRLLWESEPPIEAVHLLGVARGRLILTTPTGICALDAADGLPFRDWIHPEPGDRLPSFGRGLLAGNWVLWPTVKGLLVLDQETGRLAPGDIDDPVVPINFTGDNDLRGNLAFADGCLVVADGRRLRGFVPEGEFLEQRRKQSAADPANLEATYRLAVAEVDAGLLDAALADFAKVEHSAAAPLSRLAQSQRHAALLRRAALAQERKDWHQAAADLARAANAEFPVHPRLRALTRTADLWSAANRPEQAVPAWQSILSEPALRDGLIFDPGGAPHAAGVLAATQIDRLIQAHSRKVYASAEWQATLALFALKIAPPNDEDYLHGLMRVSHEFPNASVLMPALVELGQRLEEGGRPGAAARIYARCSRRPPHDSESVRDCVELASQHLTNLQSRLTAEKCTPILPHVAQAAWEISLDAEERLLTPDLHSSPRASDCVFFRRATELICRTARTGETRWSRDLPFVPSWLGFHADLAVAAGAQGVQALSVRDGEPVWGLSLDGVPGEHSFAGFRLTSWGLLCLFDERYFLVMDPATGQLSYGREGNGSRLFSNFFAGERSVLVQSSHGTCLLLDDRTGRTIHEHATEPTPWPRPPLGLDGHRILLVPNPEQLVLLDSATGKEIWRRQAPRPAINGLAPQVLVAGKSLFVLIDGWQLQRIDADSGSTDWTRLLDSAPLDLSLAANDADYLYFVTRNRLQRRRLDNGQAERDGVSLPEIAGSWRVQRFGDRLLVSPQAAEPVRPRLSILGGDLIALRPVICYHFPVLVFESKGLKLVQSRTLFADGPAASIQAVGGKLVIALSDKAYGF